MPPSFRFFHQMICYHILLRVLFFYSLPTVGIVRAPPGQHSVRRREEGVSHVVTRGFPLVLSSSVYFCTVFFSFFPYGIFLFLVSVVACIHVFPFLFFLHFVLFSVVCLFASLFSFIHYCIRYFIHSLFFSLLLPTARYYVVH